MASEWKTQPLGSVLELKRGYDLPSQSRREGKVPIVSSSGISGLHAESMVKAPGVVTGRYGTIGQVFFITEDFWPLNTTLYVRDFKGNDPLYISYLLRTIDYQSCSDKGAVPGVNRNHLHELMVAVPSVSEQKRIAHILGTLDDKIELNRRMNATLEAMARALFQSWFVDFDPVRAKAASQTPAGMVQATADLFPSEFEDSELGEIPKGWKVEPVGDIVSCLGGGTPSTSNPQYWDGGTHHWTTPKDFSSLGSPILTDTDRKITDAGAAAISSGVLSPGTVLLSSRAPVGYLAIAAIPVAINQGFIALIPNDRACSEFLLQWCGSVMDTIKARATGTTFPEISKKSFRPIPMILPPADVMRAFAKATRPLYAMMTANLRQSRTLATLRDALLPELLSGNIAISAIDEGGK